MRHPSPPGQGKRTGKGQRRAPSRAESADDDSADDDNADDDSADDDSADDDNADDDSAEDSDDDSPGAAVSAARLSAREAETANRNTTASVRHRCPGGQRVLLASRSRSSARARGE
jgi:hypothetical protein